LRRGEDDAVLVVADGGLVVAHAVNLDGQRNRRPAFVRLMIVARTTNPATAITPAATIHAASTHPRPRLSASGIAASASAAAVAPSAARDGCSSARTSALSSA